RCTKPYERPVDSASARMLTPDSYFFLRSADSLSRSAPVTRRPLVRSATGVSSFVTAAPDMITQRDPIGHPCGPPIRAATVACAGDLHGRGGPRAARPAAPAARRGRRPPGRRRAARGGPPPSRPAYDPPPGAGAQG